MKKIGSIAASLALLLPGLIAGCADYGPLDVPPPGELPEVEIVPTGSLSIGLTFAERINDPPEEYAGLRVKVWNGGVIFATHRFDVSQPVTIEDLPLDRDLELELTGLSASGAPTHFARAGARILAQEATANITAHMIPAYTFDGFNDRVTIWPEEHLTSFHQNTLFPWSIQVDPEATVVLTGFDDTSTVTDDRGWIRIAWSYEYENESARNRDDTIWVYDSDSPWPRFNGLELRRYFEDATEEERQNGATGVLKIDYLHPLRIFYDIAEYLLLRVDFIPITYREVQYPDGWGW